MRKTSSQSPSLLNVREAAKRFNVSENFFYQHMKTLPHYQMGRHVKFDEAELRDHFRAMNQ